MPETTNNHCSDLDRNESTIPVPSSSTVDIAMMVGKLTLSNSNGEESDASSDEGGEATGTEEPPDSGTSDTIEIKHRNQSPVVDSDSSVTSNGSWANLACDKERERRSRSSSECSDASSECSDSSSECSDSSPAEACDVKCNGRNKGLENVLNNFNKLRLNVDRQNVAETTERNVDSDEAKESTDSESSSDDDEDSEDEAAVNDTDEQYTQRGGPMGSAAKRSPPHGIKPYESRRDQNWNYAGRETRDRYSQQPEDPESQHLPDLRLLPSMTGAHNADPCIPVSDLQSSLTKDDMNEIVKHWLDNDPSGFEKTTLNFIAAQENLPPSSNFGEQTTSNGVQELPTATTDFVPNNLSMSPSPTYQLQFYDRQKYPPSMGSTSPDSSEYSQTSSPITYINSPAAGIDVITGSMDEWMPINSGSPVSDAGLTWSGNDSTSECNIALNSPSRYPVDSVPQSYPFTSELGTTTSTNVVNYTNRGLMIVNPQPSLPEVQQPMAIAGNDEHATLQYWAREGILNNINQFPPESVIPTPVLDFDNTRDDLQEYAKLLGSLDTKLSASTDIAAFMQLVPLKSLISNATDLLDRNADEFSARNDDGNTYAMVLLSRREDVILQRLARLLVTLEKMHNVPRSYMARNNSKHDLLYMAAIKFEGRHPFITGLVLEKMFKAVTANSEIWTRTYDNLRNTLIHIVIAEGYLDVLRELLDVRTTGNKTVFSLTAVNARGETPYDIALAVGSRRNDNYYAITRRLLDNYKTPVAGVMNLMENGAPNIPFVR